MTRYALLLLAPLLLALRPPVEEPVLQPNGWAYGEAGNYCMAIRELPDRARLIMRLAKWDDMSDSIILWKPGLAPLDQEDEAAIEAGYGLEVRIDGRRIAPAMSNFMIEDFLDRTGPSYRLGVAQADFIEALSKGRTLEIRRAGKPIASLPIVGSRDMAAKFRACVAKDPSF